MTNVYIYWYGILSSFAVLDKREKKENLPDSMHCKIRTYRLLPRGFGDNSNNLVAGLLPWRRSIQLFTPCETVQRGYHEVLHCGDHTRD